MITKFKIYDSFFNPILIYFPILTFILVDMWMRKGSALLAFAISASILIIFVGLRHKSLFGVYLFTAIASTCIVLTSAWSKQFFPPDLFFIGDDITLLVLGVFLIFIQKPLYAVISNKLVKNKIPMSNNLLELHYASWLLLLVIAASLLLYFILKTVFPATNQILIFKVVYSTLILTLVVFETVRVFMVRSELKKEIWLPIVSEQGKIIGSIQQTESLLSEEKYLHPVARTMFVQNEKLFLQKPKARCFENPTLWDTALSIHLQPNEMMEDAVTRGLKKYYKTENDKFVFITSYISENENEKRYNYLYINCCSCDIKMNPQYVAIGKWWTQKQIDDNLHTGIFTKDFVFEYQTLKRTGFFEAKACDCSCKLKETIYGLLDNNLNK